MSTSSRTSTARAAVAAAPVGVLVGVLPRLLVGVLVGVLVGELAGASTCCTCRAAASLRRSSANVASRKASHAPTRMSVASHGSREKANCLGVGLGLGRRRTA